MAIITFLDDDMAVSGGSDPTPASLNWGDISVTNTAFGYETNAASEQTVTDIDQPITIKAAWTSVSSTPARGQWIKNGAAAQGPIASPASVSVSAGDKLFFAVYGFAVGGNYDAGVVTVTNESDGGATLDTFNYAVQYVPTGSPGDGRPPIEGGGEWNEP